MYDQWKTASAERMQAEINQLRQITQACPSIAVLKQIMAYLYNDPSWLNLRPPLTNLTATESDELLHKVTALPYLHMPLLA